MKRMNAAVSLVVVALLTLTTNTAVFADQPPDNVQGNWTIYATNAETGETEMKHVQIAQYGNHLTGYFEGPHQSGPIQGEVNGHNIRFDTVTRTVLHFRGQVFGDTMSGSCGVRGKHAPWQATRPPTVPPPVPASNGALYNTQPILSPPVNESTYQSASAPAPQYSQQPTGQNYAQNSGQNSAQQSSYGTEQQSNYSQAPQANGGQLQQASYGQSQQGNGQAPQGSAPPAPAPLSADQLDSLVAPIALYPDALVAQILAAATNPEQITYADDWLAQNRNLTGSSLADAVNQQPWDPSVKALTQFPSVLDNLAHNLSWTSSLGQAFANQQSDVMAAVQAMRAKAQAAGTLQSNSQITVSTPASNTIVIQPANPQVVYVPQYNPAVVFGAPVVVPYYVAPPLPVASVGLYFGSGITIGAVIGGGGWGGGFGWGWHAWGVNWGCCGGGGNTTIIYNHNTYINNHTWNNTNYNGYHPWNGGTAMNGGRGYYGPNGYYHPDPGYHPGTDTHYGPNGAYHPNGYFGPDGGWHENQTGPNGGNNGNHGLIGGNGGVQHNPGYVPTRDQPNGGYNGNHGMIGGNGGVEHGPDGGRNGDHGLIGGNGGVQHTSADNNRSGQLLSQNRGQDHLAGADQNRSRFSGDGGRNRMESNRGRDSMAGHRPQQHMAREHAPAEHHEGGGGRRR